MSKTNGGTITQRLGSVVNDLIREPGFYANTREVFQEKIDMLDLAMKTPCMVSRLPSIEAELYDMLDGLGIDYIRGMSPDYYKEVVDANNVPYNANFETQMFEFMYRNFEQYPTPEEYMQRIVDRLSTSEEVRSGQSLRLRILKRFIRDGNYLRDANYGGHLEIKKFVREKLKRAPSFEDVCEHIDDGVFNLLKGATKQQKKPEGKFGLLKLADDLATGKFRTGGATKRGLYLFAMVFCMTFAQGDPVTDIEKNLFGDYYSDNLMRFITDAYRDILTDYEAIPSGQGINFKNFAEMICLYFIMQDISSEEKIKQSARMIEEVQAEYVPNHEDIADFDTIFYRDLGIVFDQTPEQFKRFILDNFNCSTNVRDEKTGRLYSIGVMQAQSEQHSAQEVHQKLVRRLMKKTDLSACNYGLWFTDVHGLDEQSVEEPEKFEDFKKLLLNIDRLLREDRFFSPHNVNRTAILVVFYYFYNESHNRDIRRRWQNFAEHCYCFSQSANYWLERAFYQPLNYKNIFDVSVIFSSYAYLNF